MTNLNELKITNVEANTEYGFFWVEFSTGQTLQCCLKALPQSDDDLYFYGPIYLKQIEIGNNGFDDGLSYDCNAWAEDVDGSIEHVELFLIEQARKVGVEIVA